MPKQTKRERFSSRPRFTVTERDISMSCNFSEHSQFIEHRDTGFAPKLPLHQGRRLETALTKVSLANMQSSHAIESSSLNKQVVHVLNGLYRLEPQAILNNCGWWVPNSRSQGEMSTLLFRGKVKTVSSSSWNQSKKQLNQKANELMAS